jgi:hypothetical protein
VTEPTPCPAARPCETCRDFVLRIRKLVTDPRHTHPGRTRRLIAHEWIGYVFHRNGHATPAAETTEADTFSRLNRGYAEHLTEHAEGRAA